MERERSLRLQNFEQNKCFFQIVDSIIRQDMIDFKNTDFSYFFMISIIAKFIIYKEEIWIKNKRTKSIATSFPRDILDGLVFKGEFTDPKLSIHYKKKQITYKHNPIQIDDILEAKEHDSVWIIDNIRDSFAHGHFYIDIENKKIIIENNFEDRRLKCQMDFGTFSMFEELTNLERIGGYTNQTLKTSIIFSSYNSTGGYQKLENEHQVRQMLQNELLPIYYEVTECRETDSGARYNDLIGFYNFVSDLLDNFLRKNKTDIPFEALEKKINEYINNNMHNYTVKLHAEFLDDGTINKVIGFIKEDKDFYNHSAKTQNEIIKSIVSGLIIHEDYSLERGIHNINSFFSLIVSLQSTNDEYYKKLYRFWTYNFLHSFIEEQRLANLFILGINNFVSNKESIYDKFFDDYSEFDISNFHYQDYSGYNRLLSKLSVLNADLVSANNSLAKAEAKLEKLAENIAKAPEEKKEIISKNKLSLETLIHDIKVRIIEITEEINSINLQLSVSKSDENGNYIDNNNKSFFNHLRNAFAHSRVRYANDRVVYNRKIILEDYNDDGILAFRCECRFLDLVRLFTNDLLLEAIKGKEAEKIKII